MFSIYTFHLKLLFDMFAYFPLASCKTYLAMESTVVLEQRKIMQYSHCQKNKDRWDNHLVPQS